MPADLDVHLVLDNAATHKMRLIHDWLLKCPRWHLHFTPTSASWLNVVECWFSLLTRRYLQRGAFRTTASLEAAIGSYIDQTNTAPKPFIWTKTADGIFASIGRFCQRPALVHGIEPFAWLGDVLTRMVEGHPTQQLNALLPWSANSTL